MEAYPEVIKEKRRIGYIDLVKCLAIILVILSHSTISVAMKFSYLFFIPVFFVCSGYTQNATYHLKSKFKHLIYPYFILSFLLFIIQSLITQNVSIRALTGIFYARYSITPPTPTVDTTPLMDFGYNAPMWFLPAMFVTFILFKGILYFQDAMVRFTIVITYLCIAWLLKFLPVLLPWSIDSAFLFAVFTWTGMWIKAHDALHTKELTILSLCIYSLCYFHNDMTNLSIRDYGNFYPLTVLGGISGSYLFINLSRLATKRFRFDICTRFSKYSLILFCIHMPILKATHYLLTRLPFLCHRATLIGILGVVFTLIVGLICAKAIKSIFVRINI
jgi:fucose 4-O-acetylase-like acetyltransferase